jgi:hypothetical protein
MGRRRLLVLVGLVLGIGYLLVLAYLIWGDVPGVRPGRGAREQALIELWDAYQQAQVAAQAEAGDAQLVSAATQWQSVDEVALLAGTSGWSFVFFSPVSGMSMDVAVSAGTAQVVNQTQTWADPTALGEGKWQEGPRDALLVFMAYGGRTFLEEHPQALIDLHLGRGDSGGPAWSVTALDVRESSLLSLLIDAETMQVLSVTP